MTDLQFVEDLGVDTKLVQVGMSVRECVAQMCSINKEAIRPESNPHAIQNLRKRWDLGDFIALLEDKYDADLHLGNDTCAQIFGVKILFVTVQPEYAQLKEWFICVSTTIARKLKAQGQLA